MELAYLPNSRQAHMPSTVNAKGKVEGEVVSTRATTATAVATPPHTANTTNINSPPLTAPSGRATARVATAGNNINSR